MVQETASATGVIAEHPALGGRELIQQASLDGSIRGFSILHRWQHSYRALTFITVKSLKMEKLLSTSSELYQHNHRVLRSRSAEWFQFGYMVIPKENWKMKDTSSSCRTSSLLLISDEPLLSITVQDLTTRTLTALLLLNVVNSFNRQYIPMFVKF